MRGHPNTTCCHWGRTTAVATVMIGVCITFGTPRVRGLGAPVERTAVQDTQESVDTISVWDGVYAEEQASRGQAHYMRLCLSCHHGGLQGDLEIGAPALAGEAFMSKWHDLTVETLFETIYATMPYEAPGSLGLQEWIDLVAYILQVNNVPRGQEELVLERDRLRRLLIKKTARGPER